jgi:hypothetical protein
LTPVSEVIGDDWLPGMDSSQQDDGPCPLGACHGGVNTVSIYLLICERENCDAGAEDGGREACAGKPKGVPEYVSRLAIGF